MGASQLLLQPDMRLIFFFVLLFCLQCADPCRSLSEKICLCEPELAKQTSCLERIRSLASSIGPLSHPQYQRCQVLLESCNCQHLLLGNKAACGLSQEDAPDSFSVQTSH